jgi:hypothetical protein
MQKGKRILHAAIATSTFDSEETIQIIFLRLFGLIGPQEHNEEFSIVD